MQTVPIMIDTETQTIPVAPDIEIVYLDKDDKPSTRQSSAKVRKAYYESDEEDPISPTKKAQRSEVPVKKIPALMIQVYKKIFIHRDSSSKKFQSNFMIRMPLRRHF